MQSLKKNWLAVSIWHEEFGEKFHLAGLFLSKLYKIWAKKNTEELSLMTLNSDAKYE